MDIDLDERVRRLLEARNGDYQAVAKATGVSYSWISKFVNRHILNPRYGTLRSLYTYLTTGVTYPASQAEDATS